MWVVNAEGGAARRFDKTDDTYSNHFLAWSPSPDILYAKKDMHNLRRLNVETQEESPLLPEDARGWLTRKPVFSPDCKKIATYWNRKE